MTPLTEPAALPNPGPANTSGPEGRRWASWGCHVSPLGSRDNEKCSGRSRMREGQKTVWDPDSSHLPPQPHPQKPHQKTNAEGRPQHFVSRWMSVTSRGPWRPWSGTPSRRCGEDYTLFPAEHAVWGPTRGGARGPAAALVTQDAVPPSLQLLKAQHQQRHLAGPSPQRSPDPGF